MSKRVKVAFAAAAVSAAVGVALSMPACESVPLTAAPGTTITLTANPEFVPANGGVSVLTAILVEPAGTFVPDGTEIFCYTNLGRVDASGKSVDGFVRVNFVSDARSGTANVCCISGGPAPSTPTTTTTTVPGTLGRSGVTASSTTGLPAFGASDVAADENQACIPITVGSALPAKIVLTANPQVLERDRSATIVATVYDGSGNPVQNVPIIFTVNLGSGGTGTNPVLTEFLDSGGAPRFTDSNGQAFDTLTSRVANGTLTKVVTVTANPPAGPAGNSATVDVTVFYATTPGR